MKVTLVTTSFPLTPNSISGIFVYRLANEIAKHTSLTVITPADNERSSEKFREPFTLISCKYVPTKWQILTHRPGGIPAALKNKPLLYFLLPFLLLSLFVSCLKVSKTTDIFHANWSITGIIAGIAAKIAGKPCITTLRGTDVNRALNSIVYKFILRFCLSLTTRIIAVSEGIRDNIYTLFPSYNNPIAVIPNGIDTRFSKVVPDPRPRTSVNIVCIGNLTENKSVDTIIRAIGLLKTDINLHLTIVGDGPDRTKLTRLVNELNISQLVTFTGVIKQDAIIKIFSHTDIFVHASLSEGRPNVVLEAMAAGIPVVAADIHGIKEIIIHGDNGITFKTGNPFDLAKQISLVAKDKSLIEKLTKNAREFIIKNKLTWDAAANRYCQLYEELLSQE